MGASESKLEFKEDIFRLAGEEDISLESDWWQRVSGLVSGTPHCFTTSSSISKPSCCHLSSTGSNVSYTRSLWLRSVLISDANKLYPADHDALDLVHPAPRNRGRCSGTLVTCRSSRPSFKYSRREAAGEYSGRSKEKCRNAHLPHNRPTPCSPNQARL